MMKAGWSIRKVVVALAVIVLVPLTGWLAWTHVCVPRYLTQAQAALAAHDLVRAVCLFEKYLAWQPNAANVHFQIAEALAEQGSFSAALEHLTHVPESVPDGAAARWHEASLLLQMNFAAKAEQAARRCLSLDPQSLNARQLLTIICRWEGRDKEAEQLFRELYELCPPSDRVVALSQLFQLHYGQDSTSETLRRLETFVEMDPADFAARLAIARLLIREGQHPRALKLLEACARQRPGDLATRAALVKYSLEAGAYDRAARLLETWPATQRDVEYWEYFGVYQSDHLQEFEQAADSFRRVLRDAPDDWRTRHRLGICLQAVSDAEAGRAELLRADTIRSLLQHDRIAETLTKLFDLLATADGRYALGELYEQVGRLQDARSWFKESLALDPDHEPSRKALESLDAQLSES